MPQAVATGVPDEPTRAAIRRLADDIEQSDGAPPLSDQALSHLGSADVAHLVASDDGRLIGYAQRDGATLELATEPTAVDLVLDAATSTGTLAWTHGRRSRLVSAFEARGYVEIRQLHQLRRPLDATHPLPADPPLADDIVVRAFEPGRDEQEWLAVNAAAFAHHPEQGDMTLTDLRARMAESWFDADGFLLAERGDELLGFHWTKVHADGNGEVYVLGVAPGAQGLGLGNGLLVRGLHHLERRGCPTVLLYVDGDNTGAIRLYEKAGFASYDTDVQWQLS
ncbi:mycothiol synthase [uncultured Jatrophihabitans sp.]|uniref:mycothiol synthase n=1 Tax=uncultured Jatrophihabitans sp. TaxID=1610747 RepID=UPI0035CA755E